MSKLIKVGTEARDALSAGVKKLATILGATLGPKGRNVLIDRPFASPMVSNDGAFIAREIQLEDVFENMGAMLLREVALNTNEVAGDGTTTAAVLAGAMVKKGLEHVTAGSSPANLKKGIDLAVQYVVARLQEQAQPADSHKLIADVASISAKDRDLGSLIADAIIRVGKDGIVTSEEANVVLTQLEIIEGMRFDRGYLSHAMVTDPSKMHALLDDAYVLITGETITRFDQIDSLVDRLKREHRPLLIISPDIEGAPLGAIIRARDEVIIVAVRAPEFGPNRDLVLEDIAILTGGQVFTETAGRSLGEATIEALGRASKIRVKKDMTEIVGGQGDPIQLEGRRQQIREQILTCVQLWERDKLEQRLSRLSSGVAVIRVGGATPIERREKDLRVEDALNAARAAVEEGVVAGGGTALVRAAESLEGFVEQMDGDEKRGAEIILFALQSPLQTLATNAGADGAGVVQQTRSLGGHSGYNALTGRYEDMFAAGIIDPVKVVRHALQNAASIASLIVTTEALIADKPEESLNLSTPARGGGAELIPWSEGAERTV